MRDSHELRLNPVGQINRIGRMIISFESVNAAAARIVEMNADKNGILLRVFDRDAFFEGNEDIGRTCHDDFEIVSAEFAGKPLRDVEGGDFLRAAKFPISAI